MDVDEPHLELLHPFGQAFQARGGAVKQRASLEIESQLSMGWCTHRSPVDAPFARGWIYTHLNGLLYLSYVDHKKENVHFLGGHGR